MSERSSVSLVAIGKHFALLGPDVGESEVMRMAGENGTTVQSILGKYAEAEVVLEMAKGPNDLSQETLERVFECFEDIWNEFMDLDGVDRESVFWKVLESDYHRKVVGTFEHTLKSLGTNTKLFKRLRRCVQDSVQRIKEQSAEEVFRWELSLKAGDADQATLPGPTAVVQGLQSQPELNGREVEILDLESTGPTHQRIQVRLRAGSEEGRVISVKLEKLVFPPGTGAHDLIMHKYRCRLIELEAADRTEKVEILLGDVRPAFKSCRGLLLLSLLPEGALGVESAASDADPLLQLVNDYARAIELSAVSIVDCFRDGLGRSALYPRSPKPTSREIQQRRKELQLVFHPDKLRQLGVPPFDHAELPQVFVEVQHIIALTFSVPCETLSDYTASMSRGKEFAETAELFAQTWQQCQQESDLLRAHAANVQQVSNAKRATEEFRNAMLALDRVAQDGDRSQATSLARAQVRVRIAEMCKLQNWGMQAQLYLLAASRVLRVHVDMSTAEGQEAMMAIQAASGLLGEVTASPHRPESKQGLRDERTHKVCRLQRPPTASECFVSSMQLQELTSQLEGKSLEACLSPMRSVTRRANAESDAIRRQADTSALLGCASVIGAGVSAHSAATMTSAAVSGNPAFWPLAAGLGAVSACLFMRSWYLRRKRRRREEVREALTDRITMAMVEYEAGLGRAGQVLLESLATPLAEAGHLNGKCILTYPVEHDIITGVDRSLKLLVGHGVPPSSVMCVLTCVAETLASYQLSKMTIGERTITPSHSDMRQAGKKLYRTLIQEACEEEGKAGIFWRSAEEFDALIDNDEKLSRADVDITLTLRKAEFPLIDRFLHERKSGSSVTLRSLRVSAMPPHEVMQYNSPLGPSHFQQERYVKYIETRVDIPGQGSGPRRLECDSMGTLLALMSGREEVQLVLRRPGCVTGMRWVQAAACAIFGVLSPVTAEGAEMRSVRRQRWLARLGLGVVLLTEAASLGDSRNAGEVQEAEGELQRAIKELKAFSDGQDEELEAKLQAVEDFFAALVGRPLAIEDQRASKKLVALAMTDTGSHVTSEHIVELWSCSDPLATLKLALKFSGLPEQCFTRDTFQKEVERHLSSPAYERLSRVRPNSLVPALQGPLEGRGSVDLSVSEGVFLIEVGGGSVWQWEMGDDGTLQCHGHDRTLQVQAHGSTGPVHLCVDSRGKVFAMKLLGVGSQGAAHVLAHLKSGAYNRLPVRPQFLDSLKACAEYCASMRLTETETMQAWEAREVGWLQCIVAFMKLGSCQDQDPEPIFRLLRRLAENDQHRAIVDDILSDHSFMLRFGSQHTGKLLLWSSYSQLCLGHGHTAVAKARCAMIGEQLESRDGNPESQDWCKRIAAVCQGTVPPLPPGRSSRSRDRKHVLSIDGGGIRGILSARFLSELERRLHCPIARLFPVMAGTSTGAIQATGLAVPQSTPTGSAAGGSRPRFSADEVLKAYVDGNVFRCRRHPPIPSMYDERPLCDLLQNLMGEILYKDLLSEVVVPAVHARQEEVHVFSREAALKVHRELKVFDVVRASSAAPAYFPAHRFSLGGEDACFLDGGLKANNPSKIALSHAQALFPDATVSVLSLGTGSYGIHPQTSRSALWWGFSPNAAGLMADLCSTDASVHRDMLIKSSRSDSLEYVRWNPALVRSIDLADDSQASLQELLAIGDASIEQAYAAEDNWFNNLLEALAT